MPHWRNFNVVPIEKATVALSGMVTVMSVADVQRKYLPASSKAGPMLVESGGLNRNYQRQRHPSMFRLYKLSTWPSVGDVLISTSERSVNAPAEAVSLVHVVP